MAQGCLTLEPFQECGWGSCEVDSCACDEGFSQNFEFFYLDVNRSAITDCNYSVSGMTALAGTLLALTCINLLSQVYIIRSKRQLIRVAPIVVGYVFLIVHTSYRVVLADESPFGEDVLYSFFLTWSFMLMFAQMIIYYNKYTAYLVKTFDVRPETKQLAKASVVLQQVLLGVLIVGFNLWWSTSFTDDIDVKLGLAQAALSIQAIQQSLFLLNGIFLMTRYIHDLVEITERSDTMNMNKEMGIKLKKNIKTARRIRFAITIINFIGVLAATLPLAGAGWLKYWVYLIYIIGILFQLVSGMLVCSAAKRKALKSGKPKVQTGLSADEEIMSEQESYLPWDDT